MTMLEHLLSPRPSVSDTRITQYPIKSDVSPIVPGQLLTHGLRCLNNRDYDNAEIYIMKYLKVVPNNYRATMLLIDIFEHTKIHQAIFLIQELVDSTGSTSELITRHADLLCTCLEKSPTIIPVEFKVEKYPETALAKKVLLLLKQEKLILKCPTYSVQSCKIIARLMNALLTKDLDSTNLNLLFDEFNPICSTLENINHVSLHIEFLKFQGACQKNVMIYIEKFYKYFALHSEWLQMAKTQIELYYSNISQSDSITSAAKVEVMMFGIYLAAENTYLSIQQNPFNAKTLEDFQLTVLDSDKIFKITEPNIINDIPALIDWTVYRQEMTSRYEFYSALKNLNMLINPVKSFFDKHILQKVVASLDLFIEYNPNPNRFGNTHGNDSPKKVAMRATPQKKQISVRSPFKARTPTKVNPRNTIHSTKADYHELVTQLKSSALIIQAHAILTAKLLMVSCEQTWLSGFTSTDLPYRVLDSTDTFLKLPSWDSKSFAHSEDEKLNSLLTYVSSITNIEIFQTNPENLESVLRFATWYSKDGKLGQWLKNIFPTLDTHTSTLYNSSKKLNVNVTPTIMDLEAFIYLLLIERQICLESLKTTDLESEIYFLMTRSLSWKPSLTAIEFWNAMIRNYYKNGNTNIKDTTSKTQIAQSLKEIRGNMANQLPAKIYGMLAIAFTELGNIDFQHKREIDYYMQLFKSNHQQHKRTSVLFGETFYKTSLPDIHNDIENVVELVNSYTKSTPLYPTVDDESVKNQQKSLFNEDNWAKEQEIVSKLLKIPIGVEVGQRSEAEPPAPGTPIAKTDNLPGAFPQTPQNLLYPQLKDTPHGNTPQMMTSNIPGAFPKTPISKFNTMLYSSPFQKSTSLDARRIVLPSNGSRIPVTDVFKSNVVTNGLTPPPAPEESVSMDASFASSNGDTDGSLDVDLQVDYSSPVRAKSPTIKKTVKESPPIEIEWPEDIKNSPHLLQVIYNLTKMIRVGNKGTWTD
ncbi:hypothetical protein BC833DRAFT_598622 [Globomyces pollinis-pini]|nr:hypothetical protein BC833DRAFT_598622 [Globomyces pollinis-pini]